MRFAVTEPADARPRRPAVGERMRLFVGNGVFIVAAVVDVVEDGDQIRLELDIPNALLHADGEDIHPHYYGKRECVQVTDKTARSVFDVSSIAEPGTS